MRNLPDGPRHLLVLLKLLEAQLVVLELGADRQLLECFGVKERLGPLVVVLFCVEQVRQCLLDVVPDLVHNDLVGRVDVDALDLCPDLVLICSWVVEYAQLAQEHRVEIAVLAALEGLWDLLMLTVLAAAID